MSNPEMIDHAKRAAGIAAAEFVKPGMIVGLGTGSTVKFFIDQLGKRCRQGLQISAIATSERSLKQAISVGIPIADIDDITFVDLTVDGADEIDEQKRMIKGGGGALLREKIVANMSREMVIVIDNSKLVSRLGTRVPLPVEIISFAYKATLHKLEQLGYSGTLRTDSLGDLFVTENNNYILDIPLGLYSGDPEEEDQRLRNITGVVETGYFFDLAGPVVIGYANGRVEIRDSTL